jgi:hypothetical protein
VKATFTIERFVQKMESARKDFFKEAQLRWKLSNGACAIMLKQLPNVYCADEMSDWEAATGGHLMPGYGQRTPLARIYL